MSTMKYELNSEQLNHIRRRRKELKIPAESLSEQIGKAKSWLSQLERGVFKSIKESDLLNLLKILYAPYSEYYDNNRLLREFLNDVATTSQTAMMNDYHFFDAINYVDYDSKDLNIEFSVALQGLVNAIQNSFQQISNKKHQFSIIQSLRIHSKNLEYSIPMTTMLSSLPLFALQGDDVDGYSAVINLINEAYDMIMIENDSHTMFLNVYASNWFGNILNSTIDNLKEAIKILLELISPSKNTAALISDFNALIDRIDANCRIYNLSTTRLEPIEDSRIKLSDLTGKHLSALQVLLQELTQLQNSTTESPE